ncbi:MAG: outer membrane beta-barrel protein [Balneolaceae bacterium]
MKEQDPLEEYFRNKAGEPDIPYREEDWLKLEKKLDLIEAKRTYRKRIGWLAAASFLILSLLGYFTLQNHQRLNQIAREYSTPPPQQPVFPSSPGGQGETETHSDTSQDSPFPDNPDRETGPVEAGPPTNRFNPEDSFAADTSQYDESTRGPYSGGMEPTRTVLARRSLPEGAPALTPHSSAYSDNLSDRQLFADTQTALAAAGPTDSRSGSAGVDPERPDTRRPQGSGLTASLALSPDISAAGSFENRYRTGVKAGITVGYRIGERFSVQAGVIPSRIHYAADSESHNAPVYGYGGLVPDKITAACLMLDIPIQIRFDVLEFTNARIFASAGLSSYIMLTERYQFRSAGGAGVQEWEDRTGSQHWFSNAALSAGYELDVHPNWSLRVEPFLRLPLQDVGWGNVRLYSMGSFFSLSYRL